MQEPSERGSRDLFAHLRMGAPADTEKLVLSTMELGLT